MKKEMQDLLQVKMNEMSQQFEAKMESMEAKLENIAKTVKQWNEKFYTMP